MQDEIIELAFKPFADVANLRIELATSAAEADVRIGMYSHGADSTTRNGVMLPGKPRDVFINLPSGVAPDASLGSEDILTLMHEFGHALGLEHPSQKDTSAQGKGGPLDEEYSSYRYSVESYNQYVDQYRWSKVQRPTTPMLFDLVGLETIYGLRGSANATDTTYFIPQNTGMTIYDTSGDDTISAAGLDTRAWIDLRPGYFSSINSADSQIGNVGIWYDSVIENATGGNKADVIIGNDVANRLEGGAGNDVLRGGAGKDTYVIGEGKDTIIDTDGMGGNDLLYGGDNNDVLYGDEADTPEEAIGDDYLDGGAGDDYLDGGGGDDTLVGGTGLDIMDGGAGDDTYVFNAGDECDRIIDLTGNNRVRFGAGLDFATMAVEQSIADDGELYLDLIFSESDVLRIRKGELGKVSEYEFADGQIRSYQDILAKLPEIVSLGSDGDDVIHGGVGNDTLRGALGNDLIFGGAGNDDLNGERGDDTLAGGAGFDTYHMNYGSGWDTIIEAPGETNLLRLDSAFTEEALNHWQEGDDLLIGLIDGSGGVRIKDYYAGGQTWQIGSKGGEAQDMAAFLATSGASPVSYYNSLTSLWSRYRQQVASNFASQLSIQGFYGSEDGKMYRDSISITEYTKTEDHCVAQLSFAEYTGTSWFNGSIVKQSTLVSRTTEASISSACG